MGSYLSEPITTKESAAGKGDGHVWASSCMQGWRTGMEDAHITISNLQGDLADTSLFSVFDGHGGKEVAKLCERHFANELLKLTTISDKGEMLKACFHRVDDMLREEEYQDELGVLKADGKPEGAPAEPESKSRGVAALQRSLTADLSAAKAKGNMSKQDAQTMMMKMMMLKRASSMSSADATDDAEVIGPRRHTANNVGCTAVCVLMTESEVVCANAGDSRAIVCRKGKPLELSHDHKPNSPRERSRIEDAGGSIQETKAATRTMYRVNGNLNLSRSLGDLEYKQRADLPPEKQMICATPDIVRVPILPDDEFIVVACDGIWDVKTNEEVCCFIRTRLQQGQLLCEVIEQLLDACITSDPKKTQGLGADNMSCIVVQLDQWHIDKAPSCFCAIS